MNKFNTTLGCIVLMSILFMSQRAWSSDMDEVGCLAEAIYFEARGEDIIGMIAVGQVIDYATHYHASHITPYWSQAFKRVRQIGGHIFYEPIN